MRKCIRCGHECYEDEHEGNEHHIIPRGLNGKDSDGRDILCDRCHDEFHKRHYGLMMTLLIEFGFEKRAQEATLRLYKRWLEDGTT